MLQLLFLGRPASFRNCSMAGAATAVQTAVTLSNMAAAAQLQQHHQHQAGGLATDAGGNSSDSAGGQPRGRELFSDEVHSTLDVGDLHPRQRSAVSQLLVMLAVCTVPSSTPDAALHIYARVRAYMHASLPPLAECH